MIPELARTLAPLQDAVAAAQAALDASNRDPDANPLDALPYAGTLIRAHQAYEARMHDLLDAIGADPDMNALITRGQINRIRGDYT